MTKAMPNPELLPRDPVGRRLLQIFHHWWNILYTTLPEDATAKPHWLTLKGFRYRARSLWALWLDAKKLVGVRFGQMTQYGLGCVLKLFEIVW